MNRCQHRIVSLSMVPFVLAAISGCASDGGPTAEPASGASPAETTWMDRHARFNAAIEGVSFEGGTVVVTQPLEGTADEAMQLTQEGDAHYAEGRYIEATASHVRAIRMEPELTEAYISLGRAVFGHGKVDFAAAAYRTAVALSPGDVEARFNLAHALWMMSESEAAVAEMEEVVRLDPEHAAAHERLAIWSYYAGDDATAWQHVHAAEAVGHQMPPQFLALLEARTPGRE